MVTYTRLERDVKIARFLEDETKQILEPWSQTKANKIIVNGC